MTITVLDCVLYTRIISYLAKRILEIFTHNWAHKFSNQKLRIVQKISRPPLKNKFFFTKKSSTATHLSIILVKKKFTHQPLSPSAHTNTAFPSSAQLKLLLAPICPFLSSSPFCCGASDLLLDLKIEAGDSVSG